MPIKRKYVLTGHASRVISEREIQIEWIEDVFNQPEKIEFDSDDSTLLHALGRISENGNRVLRVIYNDKIEPRQIAPIYFDGTMRDKL